jgi:hypothetical protein
MKEEAKFKFQMDSYFNQINIIKNRHSQNQALKEKINLLNTNYETFKKVINKKFINSYEVSCILNKPMENFNNKDLNKIPDSKEKNMNLQEYELKKEEALKGKVQIIFRGR